MARRTRSSPAWAGRMPLAGRRCAGAMLLLLMFIVAVVGILLAVAGPVWRTEMKRDKEAELLYIGDQYARALASYQAASPLQVREYPRKLEQLVLDTRQPNTTRHLRRIYRDPITGSADWGLVKDGSGCITGVYSLAKGIPLKQAGFEKKRAKFNDAKAYAEWVFIAEPVGSAGTSTSAVGDVGFPRSASSASIQAAR